MKSVTYEGQHHFVGRRRLLQRFPFRLLRRAAVSQERRRTADDDQIVTTLLAERRASRATTTATDAMSNPPSSAFAINTNNHSSHDEAGMLATPGLLNHEQTMRTRTRTKDQERQSSPLRPFSNHNDDASSMAPIPSVITISSLPTPGAVLSAATWCGNSSSSCSNTSFQLVHHQEPKSSVNTDDRHDTTMIELYPGEYRPLRSTRETVAAITAGQVQQHGCKICREHFFTIVTVNYSICPRCRTVNPTTNDNDDDAVGLGFTFETLQSITSNRR